MLLQIPTHKKQRFTTFNIYIQALLRVYSKDIAQTG